MHIIRIILLVLLSAQPALSADVRVVDGDTLIVSGNRYRLHGIDTPEHGQKCKKAMAARGVMFRLPQKHCRRSLPVNQSNVTIEALMTMGV